MLSSTRILAWEHLGQTYIAYCAHHLPFKLLWYEHASLATMHAVGRRTSLTQTVFL